MIRSRLRRWPAKSLSQLGTPDIVLNNAGAGRWLSLIETEPAAVVEMMAAALLSPPST